MARHHADHQWRHPRGPPPRAGGPPGGRFGRGDEERSLISQRAVSSIPSYPIALRLEGVSCLVVGGGGVALRKASGLLRSGARVVVVAPAFHEDLARLTGVRLEARPFDRADVEGMRLVFACTDDSALNQFVVESARAAGALAHRADEEGAGDFAGMAEVVRGRLLIAISTESASPAVAKWVREQMEARFGPEYGDLLEVAASLRSEVKASIPSAERAAAWARALAAAPLELLRDGRREEARRVLRRNLGLEG